MTASYVTRRPFPGRVGLPETDSPTGPPARSLITEVGGVRQVPRLVLRFPRLALMPRGHGQPVIDVPGWRTPESTMAPLRSYLRFLGYRARGWGLGTHKGFPERDAERLAPIVAARAEREGPVALIGWSLGGVIVREVAREIPDAVSQVIVFGSPLIGGPLYTSGSGSVSPQRQQQILDHIDEIEAARPQTVPITVMYSKRDAVVNWKAALDYTSTDATHIEVGSTHLTLGVDPDVWEITARRLAGNSA